MPKKNRLSYWRKEVLDQLVVLMGGRAAEELFVQDLSSGAQHDIVQATRIARSMVCEWGMSDELGAVAYDERSEVGQYLGMNNYSQKNYSDETAKQIDAQVRKLIEEAHGRAVVILKENQGKVQLMADMLMEFETLDSTDIAEIMGGTWDADKKHARLKAADELRKAPTPPPPPAPAEGVVKPTPNLGIQPV
jgi:cell division protease FtsH